MDPANYARFIGALVFVVGLILVIAWALKRFGFAGRFVPNPGKRRRLGVVEVCPIDARHKLVMVQRDGAEHLLLIGAGDPLVVERGIGGASERETEDFNAVLQSERSS